jgi:LPXTG-motif cell wall-anchored protein
MVASGGAGALATEQPAATALPQAADSAASATAPAAGAALGSTVTPAQQPYNTLVATSEISSPGTVGLDQPPVAPTANSAPSGGSNNVGLIAGVVVLALLIVAGVWFVRRRKV